MNREESKALVIARKVALFLKQEYGATRVLLYGSLADGCFKKDSDIDIYFEGIARHSLLKAAGHCIEVFRRHDIDLIPAAFCTDALRRHILDQGIAL